MAKFLQVRWNHSIKSTVIVRGEYKMYPINEAGLAETISYKKALYSSRKKSEYFLREIRELLLFLILTVELKNCKRINESSLW